MLAVVPARRLSTVLIVLSLLVGGGVWIYALFISDAQPTDTLHDKAFPTAAEPICKAMVGRLKDAGVVDKVATSPQQRADLAAQADTIIATTIDDLTTHVPASGDDGRIVRTWLGDWHAWLDDRATWEAQLRAGKDGPFNERQRDTGEPNSQALDKLANTNGMPSCTIPVGV
jgi:hypothetical protein